MLRAYKYRLDPTKLQIELLNKHLGSCRLIYNLALETKQSVYAANRTNLSEFDLGKQLPDLKKEFEFLKEINSQSLQQSIKRMSISFDRFFKGYSGFPNFKCKHDRQSFTVPQNVEIKDNKLSIPKFKKGIKIVLHRKIKGDIRSATVSMTKTGKYFVSILFETNTKIPDKAPINKDTTIGIDLGIKSFLVTSDGQTFDNPKYLKNAQDKIIFVQRKHSKGKTKKTRIKLARLHEKVANQRRDFLNKVSSKLVRDSQSLILENLNISGMMKNRCLAGAIGDVGWGMFVEMLRYKSEWYGKNLVQIGRFEPSSKTCSVCGSINKELTLQDREWTCSCGSKLDRDINAAINIKNIGLKNLSVERRLKNRVELPALVGVSMPEAQLI